MDRHLLCYASAMKIMVICALFWFAASAVAEPVQWQLSAESWSRPRDGRSVTQMAPLPELVTRWSQEPGKRLLIRYPGGEDGQLWAYELRSWLVALGIPLDSQELLAGSQQAGLIELELSR